jgi:hypothetical protein
MDITMEPALSTDPALAGVLEELILLEPIFHRLEKGATMADVEAMVHAEFWEIGASGRRYSREYVLAEVERRLQHPVDDVWETMEFYCRQLGSDTYLLSYTLVQDRTRKTRRSTIWQRTDSGWKIVFHQGTMVQD